jgi:hypothetical protein
MGGSNAYGHTNVSEKPCSRESPSVLFNPEFLKSTGAHSLFVYVTPSYLPRILPEKLQLKETDFESVFPTQQGR